MKKVFSLVGGNNVERRKHKGQCGLIRRGSLGLVTSRYRYQVHVHSEVITSKEVLCTVCEIKATWPRKCTLVLCYKLFLRDPIGECSALYGSIAFCPLFRRLSRDKWPSTSISRPLQSPVKFSKRGKENKQIIFRDRTKVCLPLCTHVKAASNFMTFQTKSSSKKILGPLFPLAQGCAPLPDDASSALSFFGLAVPTN